MIYGIGADIVRIARIDAALARRGLRFVEKILGPDERIHHQQRQAQAPTRGVRFLASRFAAKEAFVKALGLGRGEQALLSWHTLQIVNAPNGKPTIVTQGRLREFMEQHQLTAQVSLSDEAEYAVAFVIVEKICK